jgi:excisionase family DNA binding protein
MIDDHIITPYRLPGAAARHGQQIAIEPLAVDVKTALEISGLGRTKFYALINQGKLQTVAIGRRRLVNYRSLKALVAPEAG